MYPPGVGGLLGIGAVAGVTGKGIGVAVIDSGISAHAALSNKVVANMSFVTGDPGVADVYGHGTHIAGIIAGQASAATYVTKLYTGGIAPGANLINVRVLGADGTGLTSDVIAGIEWVIANQDRIAASYPEGSQFGGVYAAVYTSEKTSGDYYWMDSLTCCVSQWARVGCRAFAKKWSSNIKS